jgi:hypothetical protein
MKGKKLGKQSQHVRVLSTKKGRKKVVINSGHRKRKVKKRMAVSLDGADSKKTLVYDLGRDVNQAVDLKSLGILSDEQYDFLTRNKNVLFDKQGGPYYKNKKSVAFMYDPYSDLSYLGQVKKDKEGVLVADGFGSVFEYEFSKNKNKVNRQLFFNRNFGERAEPWRSRGFEQDNFEDEVGKIIKRNKPTLKEIERIKKQLEDDDL